MSCRVPSRVGESIKIEAHGRVGVLKKKARSTYVFRIEGEDERMRWADSKKEICADVKHFQEYGTLPPRSGSIW